MGQRPATEPRSTHIPVRVDDDAIRWDVTHTLVVATQTVDQHGPGRTGSRSAPGAARTATRSSARAPSDDQPSGDRVHDLAATLAELYRAEIDATGQPMSPDPFHAVENAIEHYRIDDILISTLAGEQSQLARGGPDRAGSATSPTSRSSTSESSTEPCQRHDRRAARRRRGEAA